jgi:hypothetical protein
MHVAATHIPCVVRNLVLQGSPGPRELQPGPCFILQARARAQLTRPNFRRGGGRVCIGTYAPPPVAVRRPCGCPVHEIARHRRASDANRARSSPGPGTLGRGTSGTAGQLQTVPPKKRPRRWPPGVFHRRDRIELGLELRSWACQEGKKRPRRWPPGVFHRRDRNDLIEHPPPEIPEERITTATVAAGSFPPPRSLRALRAMTLPTCKALFSHAQPRGDVGARVFALRELSSTGNLSCFNN